MSPSPSRLRGARLTQRGAHDEGGDAARQKEKEDDDEDAASRRRSHAAQEAVMVCEKGEWREF